jgi:hypothetical protein
MSIIILELSGKELEILYACFKRYLDPSIPEDATLDEMNKLSEKLKTQLDKQVDKT